SLSAPARPAKSPAESPTKTFQRSTRGGRVQGIEQGEGGPQTVSEGFAAFVDASSWSDIGADLRCEAKRSLLNFFGCALGAANSERGGGRGVVRRGSPVAARASLMGRRGRLDFLGASFTIAAAANLFDFDDTHLRTVIPPTAPVAPVVLALAEAEGFSGAA